MLHSQVECCDLLWILAGMEIHRKVVLEAKTFFLSATNSAQYPQRQKSIYDCVHFSFQVQQGSDADYKIGFLKTQEAMGHESAIFSQSKWYKAWLIRNALYYCRIISVVLCIILQSINSTIWTSVHNSVMLCWVYVLLSSKFLG